jgi:hypothetical protein
MVAVCVKLPEVPLIRIVNPPVAALLVADSVSVLTPVVLLGLKEAVTPRGSLAADKLTAPVNPFCGVMLIVEVTLPPRARLSEFGDAEIAKFGGAATVSETEVLCDNPPELPVIVIEKVPRAAVLLAVNVSVLAPVVLEGLNPAVTALGSPVADRLTLPSNPLSGFTVMVLVPFAPWTTLRLLGEAESV